jgi:hypothetical protein
MTSSGTPGRAHLPMPNRKAAIRKQKINGAQTPLTDHPVGAGLQRADRVDFDSRVRLEFKGAQLSSDGGLLVMRELGDALGLSSLASAALRDTRPGKNTVHRLDGLFRQSVFGRLAGYEDVKDADRLALDPAMRQVVGGRAVDAQAASASQMGRFETETLALPANRAALADLSSYPNYGASGLRWESCVRWGTLGSAHCPPNMAEISAPLIHRKRKGLVACA